MTDFERKFAVHQDILSAIASLLMKKSKFDKSYSVAHLYLSDELEKLTHHTQDQEVQAIISALSRNFGNLSSHLEQMSFDLQNDVNHDFRSNELETKKLIYNLKNDLQSSHDEVLVQKKKTSNARDGYIKLLKKVEDFKAKNAP